MSENGQTDDKDAAAAAGEYKVSQWMDNITSTDTQACFYVLSPGVSRHENLLFNTYYCFRVVCVHFLPCMSLVVLNSALVGAIRTAQRRRHRLLSARKLESPSTSRRSQEADSSPVVLRRHRLLLRRQPNPEGSARLLRLDNDQAPATSTEDASRGTGQRRTGSDRRQEGSSTTLMLVIVVGVFLLVETPLAVFIVLMIAENTFGAIVLTTFPPRD